MAGGKMLRFILPVFRSDVPADFGGVGAAGMEPAAGGRIHRAGDLTLQHIFILFSQTGIRLGDSLQQELCIGVPGGFINVLCTAALTDLAQEHDAHTVGKVTDNA